MAEFNLGASEGTSFNRRRDRKVLVVDDEAVLASNLMRALSRAGYQASMATGGPEALQLLEAALTSGPYDLLVTDIHMPELRGDELQRLAREKDHDLAVVLVTALQDITVAVECLTEGVHDYVTKPFDLSDIVVRVGKALEKRDLIIAARDYRDNLEKRVADQTAHIHGMYLHSLEAFAKALDAKDMNTHDHSHRVSTLASALALRVSPDNPALAEMVRTAGILHDIGKIGVPDAILNKPGKLEPAEFDIIKTHPETSEAIVGPLFPDPSLLLSIRHHHEHWNGGGYPDGLAGEAIHLGARIIAVADAFDAMTSPRPYRPVRMTPDQAIATIQQVAGSQFDAHVVEALLSLHAEGYLD